MNTTAPSILVDTGSPTLGRSPKSPSHNGDDKARENTDDTWVTFK
jgi:hypothetical protein